MFRLLALSNNWLAFWIILKWVLVFCTELKWILDKILWFLHQKLPMIHFFPYIVCWCCIVILLCIKRFSCLMSYCNPLKYLSTQTVFKCSQYFDIKIWFIIVMLLLHFFYSGYNRMRMFTFRKPITWIKSYLTYKKFWWINGPIYTKEN